MGEETEYQTGIAAFEELLKQIEEYGSKLSEADTRCKIIDKILTESLGWREINIRREEYANEGYIDYVLRVGKKGMVIEAKKIAPLFELPAGIGFSSSLSIGSLLRKEKTLEAHYNQVLKYCLDAGLQFGCFTNGLQWVIFPAIRTDGINLHRSKVIVFHGIEEIHRNFINFWNLLSRSAVESETNAKMLLPEVRTVLQSYQVNSGDRQNEMLNRNMLSGILAPVLPAYFGDLIGPELLKKLEHCYVESPSLSEWSGEVTRLSKTLDSDSPVHQPNGVDETYEFLNRSILSYSKNEGRSGVLNILLGRVGSGKSTFLNYYFYIKNKTVMKTNLVYLINWLEYDGQKPMSDFFYEEIEEKSRQNGLYQENSTYETLEKAFQNDIVALTKGPLGNIDDNSVIKTRVADLLIDIGKRREYFYSRLFDYLRKKRGICTILVFDNIDQLQPEMQEDIIKLAYSLYQEWGSFTLISMREENFVKSKMEGSLSTIQCQRFVLPRPSIVPIIERRLACFSNDVAGGMSDLSLMLQSVSLTSLDLKSYIDLISKSLVSQRDKVKNFLEAIALGNIRESLEFFRTFLAAGNTDSGKIITIMKQHGEYLVPDHEFIKSISLGSRRYFSENESPILNLFSISDMEHPSHFTRLRILYCLSMFKFQSKAYGMGYESIDRLKDTLGSIGVSEPDVRSSVNALTRKRLIENDLHSLKYMDKANAVRITPTGDYYLDYLANQFAFLDLMQQDTPILDEEVYRKLDSLAESTKIAPDRFERVRAFAKYLSEQESEEVDNISKITNSAILTHKFMPAIQEHLEPNLKIIAGKLEKK